MQKASTQSSDYIPRCIIHPASRGAGSGAGTALLAILNPFTIRDGIDIGEKNLFERKRINFYHIYPLTLCYVSE
jgi:hypothetical protein